MRTPRRLPMLVSLIVLTAAIGFGLSPSSTDAQQGPPDLEVLNQRLLGLFELNGVVYTDADEQTNRLVVGVSNHGIETSIRARLAALGVPADLVDIVDAPEIYQVDSLQTGVFRPVIAGVQINFPGFLCSLGFNATMGTTQGFVTASHCTTTQGGVESTPYYQPLSPAFIGTEIADPTYFSGSGCPSSYVCRYSDSAFVQYENGVTGDLGAIARTSGPNNGSLNEIGTFTITGEGTASVGTTVSKVGRTTGWTQAKVSSTCANVGVSGTNIVQLCQNIVTSRRGAIVKGGDSGSGVFTINSGTDVTLQGILWGGSSNGRTMVYSPITAIEQELGPLTTEASGGTPATTGTISGVITDADTGQVIHGASVSVDSGQSTTTDSGAYTLNDVPTGDHSVTASALGYTPVVEQATVNDGETTPLDFALSLQPVGATMSASINYATTGGRNHDKNLQITVSIVSGTSPVSGASVSLDLQLGGVTITSGTGQTGSDGTVTFTLHNAPSGTYHTEITDVTASGLTWDGVSPPNSYTK